VLIGTAYFPVGVDIATSGQYPSTEGNSTLKNWPASSEGFVVNGKLTCTGSGCATASGWVACDPLVINPPPKAITVPALVASRSAQFEDNDYTSASSRYYYIGSIPKFRHNITAIFNNDLAQCDSIINEIKGAGITETARHSLAIQANEPIPVTAQSMTASSAFSSVAANTSVTARVIAKCRGNYDTLVTATATVVPNPSFAAECEWVNKSNTALAGEPLDLNLLKNAPTLTSISNNYGRCTGFVLSVDGISPYGNLPATFPTPVNNIKLYAQCNAPYGLIVSNGAACPVLTTKDSKACSSCEMYCDEETCDALNINGLNSALNPAPKACYHITSASLFNINPNSSIKINGKTYNGECYEGDKNNCLANNFPEADEGGWYVYLIGGGYVNINIGSGFNTCPPKLKCNMQSPKVTEGSSLKVSDLSCTHGSLSGTSFTSSTPGFNWQNLARGDYYDITGIGTCGSTALQTSCLNKLEVVEESQACDNVLTMPGGGWNGGNPNTFVGNAGCYTLACSNGSAPWACVIPAGSSVKVGGTAITSGVAQGACNNSAGKIIEISGSNVKCAGQW
jgi:hypothetical protein